MNLFWKQCSTAYRKSKIKSYMVAITSTIVLAAWFYIARTTFYGQEWAELVDWIICAPAGIFIGYRYAVASSY